jgi:transcriptional regulator with XRE-family HTH domain
LGAVEELREAVQRRTEETSQRQTAKEIGISPTGLRGFLAGAEPYGPSLSKLLAWYEWRTEGVELLSVLTDTVQRIPDDKRKVALTELRRLVRDWSERWSRG